MFILHLALGGCLRPPPVRFGVSADSGGHIAYVIAAAIAQAACEEVEQVSIVTRLFVNAALGECHSRPREWIGNSVTIDRIASPNRDYLEKEALAAEIPAITQSFCDHLAALPRMPDVIHAHFADAAQVALEARRRFGIPTLYTPHSLGLDKARHAPSAGLETRIASERIAIEAADALIVSTRDEAERQVASYGSCRSIHRIPPGVPLRLAHGETAVRLSEWLDDLSRPIILAIARPVRKKNLAAIVRAYASSPALMRRANLVIIAGQHDVLSSAEELSVVAELRQLCAAPSLRGRVALPPMHEQADITALYQRCARGGVFVNPALHEPFGLTLIEAAAAGVPVVATREGGPAEILATLGHGLLIDPRDEAAIAAACLRLVNDPELHGRLAASARQRISAYDWRRYASKSVAVYNSARRSALPRLLACDIDNTLTGCAAGAKVFAEWASRRAMPFVVATGRGFGHAREVLRQWHLPEPDAYIVDVGTRIMMPAAHGGWRECKRFAKGLDKGWDRAAALAALESLALLPQPPDTAGPHKLSYFGSADDAGAIRIRLAQAGLAARVLFSHDIYIDVLAPCAGKAAAIAAYAGARGIALADCIAAGDSGNDIDMLELCGHAILVFNAEPILNALPQRHGLLRTKASHAAGVMEGLAMLGLTHSSSAITA